MEKARRYFPLRVNTIALALFVVVLAQAADVPRKTAERGPVEKLPVAITTEITHCVFGGQDCPCTKLTVKYEDDSVETRTIAISPKGKWKDVLDALGDAMDKVQADHARILKARAK